MDTGSETVASREMWHPSTASQLESCVTQLVNALARGTADIAADHELTYIDYALLRQFLGIEEWTTTQLGGVLPLAPSSISRVVTKLVYRGLIQRRRLLSDRRVVILTLTEDGMALTQDLHRRVRAYEAELCENVSDDEFGVLGLVTSKIMANYDART